MSADVDHTIPLHKGPFYNVKNRGLVWVGVPEQCDRCKEVYPMSWIEFIGTHFLCSACHWNVTVEKRDINISVAEDLLLIQPCGYCFQYFTVNDLVIDMNQLVCRTCAQEASHNRMIQGERESEERRRRELEMELKLEKYLPPAQREEREKERVKAYYDKMN